MKGGERLEKELMFAVDEVRHIDASEYGSDDYMLARIKFLSTRPNSHEIVISEDVLRAYAPSVLGKWVTGEVMFGDCTTHTDGQTICGIVPREQDVEFVEADDGYLDAYVDCIISKRYAKQYCDVFSENDDMRAVSIEAAFGMKDEHEAESFDIKTITTLGKGVKPSVPGADIVITRFSGEEAEAYYCMSRQNSLSKLKTFVEGRKTKMAEEKYVNHSINTSKDAVYTGEWDGDKAKKDLVKEKNYKTLAPKVCLKLEDGWEDREVTKLGYPVMGLYDGEWRYSSKALASAQAYAEQNDEAEVLNKIKKIKKNLGLDDNSEGKEEKMEEIKESVEMAEVEKPKQDEAEMAKPVAEEVMADPIEHEHDDDEDDDCEHKMSEDEMLAKIAQLEKDIEDRDHIIMERDTELADLRAYKAAILAKENATRVDGIMEEIKAYITDEQFASFREEGLACDESNIDAWSNKVKAVCFSEVKKNIKKDDSGVFSFAMPTVTKKVESDDVWTRIKNNY